MSESENAVTWRRQRGIGTVTFNRPDSLNAMNLDMARGFRDAARQLTQDETVRVIVLESKGRSFMAGGDLAYFKAAGDRDAAARQLIGLAHETVEILADAPQLTIASVHGAAAGAGMSIALGCDFVIAADNAVFNAAYARIGTTPDCGGSWYFPRLLGMRKALEIALLCENIDAAEALRLGIVNRVVPFPELENETLVLAHRLVNGSAAAQASIKKLVRGAFDTTLKDQLAAEIDSFASRAASAEFDRAISAFFDKKNK